MNDETPQRSPVMKTQPVDQLLQENEDLRRRLEEAEDALRALRAGEADAVLVEAGGEQVFTLESADKAYWLLVAQMPHPAATLTADGAIISCNRRFADLLLRPLPSLLGEPIHGFVTSEGQPALEALLRESLAADSEGEVTLRRADGALVPTYLGVRALREGALGLCLMVTDLTELRHYQELQRTQEALLASEERLDLAQRAGRIGTFEWNIRTGAVTWSATKEELYGLPAGGFGGRYADWKQAVHPDDRDRAEADRLRAVAERTELDTEFRIVRPDGETRWIASKGKVFYTGDGEPLRMLGVSQDITERKRIEKELRDADRKKDEFLATLAHELRNPLAPMLHAMQILNARGPLRPELEWARGVLDRQAHVMARLLEDLLDVSRISRDQLELRREWVELAAVLEVALETSRPVIEAGSHELTVTLPPEPIHLHADPLRLAQVFANLLNNAAKYTEEGGRIRLIAECQGSDVIVSVQDNGIGIAAGTLASIFEMFSQAKPALVRSQGGLGIGLSLVKGLVELHGGSIEAHSDGPGRGSEFVVRLPVVAERPAPEPVQTSDDEPTLTRTYRILIVDDNHDSVDSLAMLLEITGNEVATAYDGEQAVEVAEAVRPDVVLLDIGMPKLNGYDACRRIREQPWGEGMFIIALTGWGQEEDRRRTEEAGFNRHMVKPVDADILMKLLAIWTSEYGGQPTKR
jgi:PAS domain S-box-containing protein